MYMGARTQELIFGSFRPSSTANVKVSDGGGEAEEAEEKEHDMYIIGGLFYSR